MAKKKKKRSDADRNIFVYWNGERNVKADPLVLWHRIDADPELVPEDHIRHLTMEKDPEGAEEAGRIVAEAVGRIFNVASVEDGGLTTIERWQLMFEFYDFISQLKKKLATSPTPQPHVDSTPQD